MSLLKVSTLKWFIEHPLTHAFIVFLILLNAVTLGLETSPSIMARAGDMILFIDASILLLFILEISIRIYVYKRDFFRDSWSLFDLTIVALATLTYGSNVAIFRMLRILRIFRLFSAVKNLRMIVTSLLHAFESLFSIMLIILTIMYVFAVMATHLYGATFPDKFGTLGMTMITLFQIMTGDGWYSLVVGPVMEKHPYAWALFFPFVIIATFTILNVFVAIIVQGMNRQLIAEEKEKTREQDEMLEVALKHIKKLTTEVEVLKGTADKGCQGIGGRG